MMGGEYLNLLDYIIIGIIALSTIYGLNRGFIQTIISLGGSILSILASLFVYSSLVSSLSTNASVINTLMYYTDAKYLIGDVDLANMKVVEATPEILSQLTDKVQLPMPLDELLIHNIQNRVFAPANIDSLSDYVSQTIISVSLNVLIFLACFFAFMIIISILLNLLNNVFHFRVLKHFEWLGSGIAGFVRGIIFVYLLFTILPLMQTIIPLEIFNNYITDSSLAPAFQNNALIIGIMNRHL